MFKDFGAKKAKKIEKVRACPPPPARCSLLASPSLTPPHPSQTAKQESKRQAESMEMQRAVKAFAGGGDFAQDKRYGDLAQEVGKDYDWVEGHEAKPVRFDSEAGMKVYKAAALGVSKPGSGTTPLCPFDCDCCF
jgi:hypothetical protein